MDSRVALHLTPMRRNGANPRKLGVGAGRVAAVIFATVFAVCLPAASHATPAPPPSTPAWAGVSELVVVDLDANGAVSPSLSQTTVVTAASSTTVHVGVPMSPSGLRRVGPGSAPPVTNDVAQFTFDHSGTQTQTVSSDFVRALPVTVTPRYELDGKPTTPDELARSRSNPRRRSGVLTVSYEIVNITRQTTTVSFVDAAGTQRTQTVTQPVPIAGQLTLTFPKNAAHIDAPGAALTPGAKGVGASWELLLAPPLGPPRETISYSMNVTKAVIPRARLAVGVIVPSRPVTGEAPEAIGAAVASQRIAAQGQLAQAQSRAQASLEQVQGDLVALEQARSSGGTRDRNASDAVSNGLAQVSDGELADLAQSISTAAAQARAEVEATAARIHDALDGLRPQIGDHLDQLTAHAGKLALLKAATDALTARLTDLSGHAAEHVTAAADLKTLIAAAITSLDLFPDHTTPAWVQLAGNLAAVQAKADVVVGAATDIRTEVAQIDAAVQQLSSDVVMLTSRVRDLIAAVAGIRDQVNVIVAAAENELEAARETIVNQGTELRSQADAVRSNLGGHTRDATALVDAERQQTSSELATKALTTAASVQGALAGAQSKAAQASATYVQLLALTQLGLANQLPAGNAIGATVQSGAYVLRISGTR